MKDFFTELQNKEACISYLPMKDEVDPKSFSLHAKVEYLIPQNRNLDPFEFLKTIDITKSGYILVPGRKFDRFGGRKGRGGGWYDRLLSKLPKHWIRIGVCTENEFSEEKLHLNPWDQKMDWVVVFKNNKLDKIFKCGK